MVTRVESYGEVESDDSRRIFLRNILKGSNNSQTLNMVPKEAAPSLTPHVVFKFQSIGGIEGVPFSVFLKVVFFWFWFFFLSNHFLFDNFTSIFMLIIIYLFIHSFIQDTTTKKNFQWICTTSNVFKITWSFTWKRQHHLQNVKSWRPKKVWIAPFRCQGNYKFFSFAYPRHCG